jgi:hypothetical protein
LQWALIVCWGAFGVALALTLLLSAFIPYRLEWYIPGAISGALLMAAGIVLYLSNKERVRTMSLLLEVGAIALAIGWVAAILL